jgi:tetratricopeptide (TPR) repeat protein
VSASDAPASSPRGTKARAARAKGQPAQAKGQPAQSKSTGQPTQAKGQPAPSKGQPAQSKGTRSAKARMDPDLLAALEEERDFLLRSLRDLEAEHDVGDLDDHDYAELQDDYTARAAAVLRAIEGQRAELASAPRRSTTQRVVVAVVVALLAVGAGVLVAKWSGSRGAGDSITGGIRSDTRQQLVDARQQAAAGQYLDAIKTYQAVIDEDPANLEALAYKGWMLRLVAQQASGSQRAELLSEAKASLQAALATNSKDSTSLVFMAAVLDDLGQPQAALADLDRVTASSVPDVVQPLVSQLRSHLQSEIAASH